jgi:hypothetical protein
MLPHEWTITDGIQSCKGSGPVGLQFQNYKTCTRPEEAKSEIVEVCRSVVVSHQNVILNDINVHEFLVIAYRYIKKGDLFHLLKAQ